MAQDSGVEVFKSIKDSTLFTDTSSVVLPDSVSVDTIANINPKQKKSIKISTDALDENIEYNASDSIIYDIVNSVVYLYGNAFVKQGEMSMKAAYIEFDFNTKEVKAESGLDSLGHIVGTPLFKDGEQEIRANEMRYNFETKKGRITQLLTQEGEGFLRAENVKRVGEETMFGEHAFYTTCNHEHPHFKITSRKVKVIPNKIIITGPANLKIADIPTPLVLPFGIFPLQKGRTSGILLPKYGEAGDQGFFFRDLGFYLGISEYWDFKLLADVYSRGQWKTAGIAQYKKRYKYSGSFNLEYGKSISGINITPEYSSRRDFRIRWSHNQDAKAHPYRSFSASINAATSSFNDNFIDDDYTQLTQNVLTSSINFSRKFPNSPFSMTVSANHSQNTSSRTISFTLPNLNFRMNNQYPFKRKNRVGAEKWYEQIYIGYNFNFTNSVSTIDSTLFEPTTLDKLRNGIRHNFPINLGTYKLFKHINVTPRFNYNESWSIRNVSKAYQDSTVVYEEIEGVITPVDTLPPMVVVDTTWGFKTTRFFDGGLSMNTTVYGMFNFKKGKLKAIRHVMRPSINFTAHPDFGKEFWGSYFDVLDTEGDVVERYTPFELSTISAPAEGLSARVSFDLNNNIEMKLRSKTDTSDTDRKVKIFETLNLTGIGYDFAREEFKWNTFRLSAATTLANFIKLSANANFDPYMREQGVRVNTTLWKNQKKLAQLTSGQISLSGSFKSKSKGANQTNEGTDAERQDVLNNLSDFVDFKIPFTFGYRYYLNFSRRYNSQLEKDEIDIVQTFSFDVTANITPRWKFTFAAGYDFTNKKINVTSLRVYRDLHCWDMNFNWYPSGAWRRYEFTIQVKSSVLQDLKLQRTRRSLDSFQ